MLAVAKDPSPVTLETPTVLAVAKDPSPVTLETPTVLAVAKDPSPDTLLTARGVPADKIIFPFVSFILKPLLFIILAVIEFAPIRAASRVPALILTASRFAIFALSIAASCTIAFVIDALCINAFFI